MLSFTKIKKNIMNVVSKKIKSMLALVMAFAFFASVSLSSCSGGQQGSDEGEATTEEPAAEEGKEHPANDEHPAGEERPADSAAAEGEATEAQ